MKFTRWWQALSHEQASFNHAGMLMAYVLLVIILGTLAVMRLGDWEVNLAAHYADGDNIVSYAQYFNAPDRYSVDSFSDYAKQQLFASWINWAPILVSHYMGIPIVLLSYVMALLQALLCGLAMAWFAKAVTNSTSAAILAGILLTATSAWSQNFAFYGVPMGVPYAGTFVIPFVLVAAGASCLLRWRLMMLALVGAALTHPSIAIYATTILTFYLVFANPPRPLSVFFARFLWLIPPVALVMGLATILLGTAGEKVTADEIFKVPNLHFFSYLDPARLYDVAVSYFGWLCLSALAIYSLWDELSLTVRRFILAAVLGVAFLAVAAVIGISFRILSIIQLIPLRAPMLLPIVAIPFISIFLLRIASSSIVASVAAIQLLQLLILGHYCFFWAPILVLAIVQVFSNFPKPTRWVAEFVAALVLLGWNMLAAKSDEAYASWIGFRPGTAWPGTSGFFTLFEYAIALALILAAIRFFLHKASFLLAQADRQQLVTLAVLLCLGGISIRGELQKVHPISDFSRRLETSRDLADAQRWAATQTPENTVFIVENMPFRTMSQRAIVKMSPSFGFVYSRSRNALNRDLALLEFYGQKEAWDKGIVPLSLMDTIYSRIYNINENRLQQFALIFGGNYYVRAKTWAIPGQTRPARLSLPVAYENDNYVIHRIQ